jgi:hypothetical protein
MPTYRIVFQGVKTSSLLRYMSADPRHDQRAYQTTPNSRIPDSDWYTVKTLPNEDPWWQYEQLRKWADGDEGFVRRVRLEKMLTANPYTWTQIPNPTAFRKALP